MNSHLWLKFWRFLEFSKSRRHPLSSLDGKRLIQKSFIISGLGFSHRKEPALTLVQTATDSAVRVLSLPRFCLDFRKILSGFCLSGQSRTRQSCRDFHWPCPPTFALGHFDVPWKWMVRHIGPLPSVSATLSPSASYIGGRNHVRGSDRWKL